MSSSGRLQAIDQFRGFAIFLMILANYMNNVRIIPAWLKHAPDVGYTLIDLIAPLFVFAMGLTYGVSFRRRYERDGAWNTYQHFITRYLALLGLGYMISEIGILSGQYHPNVSWGLLQALGAAGLIALLFIRLSVIWRWVVGLGLLVVYQFLLDNFWLEAVREAPHNGPWGAISWGAMLVIATAMADIYHNERLRSRVYPLVACLATFGGFVLTWLVPISKHRASLSYVLVSLGISGIIFFGFFLLDSRWQLKLPILNDWGRNPLLLYLLHYVLLAIFALPPFPNWYVEAPLWLVLLQLLAMVAVLSWIGRFLNRHRLYFVL